MTTENCKPDIEITVDDKDVVEEMKNDPNIQYGFLAMDPIEENVKRYGWALYYNKGPIRRVLYFHKRSWKIDRFTYHFSTKGHMATWSTMESRDEAAKIALDELQKPITYEKVE